MCRWLGKTVIYTLLCSTDNLILLYKGPVCQYAVSAGMDSFPIGWSMDKNATRNSVHSFLKAQAKNEHTNLRYYFIL